MGALPTPFGRTDIIGHCVSFLEGQGHVSESRAIGAEEHYNVCLAFRKKDMVKFDRRFSLDGKDIIFVTADSRRRDIRLLGGDFRKKGHVLYLTRIRKKQHPIGCSLFGRKRREGDAVYLRKERFYTFLDVEEAILEGPRNLGGEHRKTVVSFGREHGKFSLCLWKEHATTAFLLLEQSTMPVIA
jgi:hypothetical protein